VWIPDLTFLPNIRDRSPATQQEWQKALAEYLQKRGWPPAKINTPVTVPGAKYQARKKHIAETSAPLETNIFRNPTLLDIMGTKKFSSVTPQVSSDAMAPAVCGFTRCIFSRAVGKFQRVQQKRPEKDIARKQLARHSCSPFPF